MRSMNWIHDHRTPDGDNPYTIRVLCDRCTPVHTDIEVVDGQAEDETCDRCSLAGTCPECSRAINWCRCAPKRGATGTSPATDAEHASDSVHDIDEY